MLLADRLDDHGPVRRHCAGVVGDEQRATLARDVHDPLDLDSEPIPVEKLVDRPINRAFDPFGASPVGDVTLGLEPRELLAQVVDRGRRALACLAERQFDRQTSIRAAVLRVFHSERFLQGPDG